MTEGSQRCSAGGVRPVIEVEAIDKKYATFPLLLPPLWHKRQERHHLALSSGTRGGDSLSCFELARCQ